LCRNGGQGRAWQRGGLHDCSCQAAAASDGRSGPCATRRAGSPHLFRGAAAVPRGQHPSQPLAHPFGRGCTSQRRAGRGGQPPLRPGPSGGGVACRDRIHAAAWGGRRDGGCGSGSSERQHRAGPVVAAAGWCGCGCGCSASGPNVAAASRRTGRLAAGAAVASVAAAAEPPRTRRHQHSVRQPGGGSRHAARHPSLQVRGRP
jgi:hypothetical protein